MAPKKMGKTAPVDALVLLIQAVWVRPLDALKAGINWLLEAFIAGLTSLIEDWDSKHAVPKLLIVLLAFWLSVETRVEWAVVKVHLVSAPHVEHFVHRQVVVDLYDAFTAGNDFIIVEGGNRMGKSVAVATAIANLSMTMPVRHVTAEEGESTDELLTRLVGIAMGWQALLLQQFLPDWLAPPRIEVILKARHRTVPTPVFVVESAELLSVNPTLKALFNLAKEMADKRTGRFVFVFSPTDKMEEMRNFGSLSRATILPVLDMTYSETRQFLADRGCTEDRINATYDLLGGHLTHFASLESHRPVTRLCRGAIHAQQVEVEMLADVETRIKATTTCAVPTECACPALCAVAGDYHRDPVFATAVSSLVRAHLVRSSLQLETVLVDSPLVKRWMGKNCDCETEMARFQSRPQGQ